MTPLVQLLQGALEAESLSRIGMDDVQHAQVLIEKGPIGFVAAVGWLLVLALGAYVVRLHGRSLRRELAHHKEVDALRKEFQEKTEEEHRAATERLIKLEMTAHGLLDLVEMLRELLYDARKQREARERRKPPTNPGARGGAE